MEIKNDQVKKAYDKVYGIISEFTFRPEMISEIKVSPTLSRAWGSTSYNPKQKKYSIKLNKAALSNEYALEETILHELIHTLPGCMNHGELWQSVAKCINAEHGYTISRVNSSEDLGISFVDNGYKYIIKCTECGKEIGYMRRSYAVKCPEAFRCTCGGKLKRVS